MTFYQAIPLVRRAFLLFLVATYTDGLRSIWLWKVSDDFPTDVVVDYI